MKNCIVLGSGRSGTSMVAGTLAKSGYFMGNHPTPHTVKPEEFNPKGQYEDVEINGINETILEPVVPKRPLLVGNIFYRDRPVRPQRWLARVPLHTTIPSPLEAVEKIIVLTKNSPFCFKDPRFSYTLPVWQPYLHNTVFLCIFRDPASTVKSILKNSKTARHLKGFSINSEQALEMWTLMYQHIIEFHSTKGDWLFLEYNQVLTEEGLAKLEEFTEAKVDKSFPDGTIRRTRSTDATTEEAQKLYEHLCYLAKYKS
jgi:hypothetical protein